MGKGKSFVNPTTEWGKVIFCWDFVRQKFSIRKLFIFVIILNLFTRFHCKRLFLDCWPEKSDLTESFQIQKFNQIGELLNLFLRKASLSQIKLYPIWPDIKPSEVPFEVFCFQIKKKPATKTLECPLLNSTRGISWKLRNFAEEVLKLIVRAYSGAVSEGGL
jgi:hypothetical protein